MLTTPDSSSTTPMTWCSQSRTSQKWPWESPLRDALQGCPQVQLLQWMMIYLKGLVLHPHHCGFKLWHQSIKLHIRNQLLQTCTCFLKREERVEAGIRGEAMWAFWGCLCSFGNIRKEERLRFKVDMCRQEHSRIYFDQSDSIHLQAWGQEVNKFITTLKSGALRAMVLNLSNSVTF